jgi:hypothetical protein
MKAANNETAKHPLVGAGVHWVDHKGFVHNQAVILDVIPDAKGDIALLQYLGFSESIPSPRRLISLAELCSSDGWVLYSSVDEMNEHYKLVDEQRNVRLFGASSAYEDHIKNCRQESFRSGLIRVLDTAFFVSLWLKENHKTPVDGQVLVELTRMVMREAEKVEREHGEIE